MPNYMEEAFAPAEAHYKAAVIQDTWGHLFPDKPYYEGYVRIASTYYGATGDAVIIHESDTLPGSSPWWYDAITEFANKAGEDMECGDVMDFPIKVEIVHCEEELEDWQIEEEYEPKQWTEIQVTQIGDPTILVTTNQERLAL